MIREKSVYGETVTAACDRNMSKLDSGKIRNHKLTNGAAAHTGELEEAEMYAFLRLIKSKSGREIMNLKGSFI